MFSFRLVHFFVKTLDLLQFYGQSNKNWGLFEMLRETEVLASGPGVARILSALTAAALL